MQTCQLLINNEWLAPDSGQYFDALDPYSGQAWAQVPQGNAKDVDKAA
jgi:aldehyde dehydrogenase (NAD+)